MELSVLPTIQYCAISAVLLGSVVGIAIFTKWVIDVKQMNELIQTNLRTELEQLKKPGKPSFFIQYTEQFIRAHQDRCYEKLHR